MKKILEFLFNKKVARAIGGFLSGTAVGFLVSAGIVQPEHRMLIEETIEQAVIVAIESTIDKKSSKPKPDDNTIPEDVEMIEVED